MSGGTAEKRRTRCDLRPAAGRAIGAWPGFLDPVRDLVRRAAGRIRSWALAELGAGRLIPWIAIAFGCGILVYFSIDQEPAPWATLLLLCLAVAVAVLG
ncbi:MAG: competence protein ComEC, partial [Xanthobacteraceae bacterium]